MSCSPHERSVWWSSRLRSASSRSNWRPTRGWSRSWTTSPCKLQRVIHTHTHTDTHTHTHTHTNTHSLSLSHTQTHTHTVIKPSLYIYSPVGPLYTNSHTHTHTTQHTP